jgi:hypothetical protein
MYGLLLLAPIGVIDKRPGGISEQPTEFASCMPPGAAWPSAFFRPCGLNDRRLCSGSQGIVWISFLQLGGRQDAVTAQALLMRDTLNVIQPVARPGDANARPVVPGARSRGDAD